MTTTQAVIFSTSFSVLMYLGFVRLFKSKKIQELVRGNSAWRYLQPNNICTIRMLMAWFASFIFFYLDWHVLGIFIFTVSATLDGVDGLVARTCRLETEFGKWYDPLCDKGVYVFPILFFLQKGIIEANFFWVYLFLSSDFFGQFISRSLQKKWGWSTAANEVGKMKTVLCFALIIYCALLMDMDKIPNFAGQVFIVCSVLALVSAVSKIMTKIMWKYFLLTVNLACCVVGLFSFHASGDYRLLAVAALAIMLELTLMPAVFLNFFKRLVLQMIPKSVTILSGALAFFVFAFLLKVDDEYMIGVCLMVVSSAFLLFSRSLRRV